MKTIARLSCEARDYALAPSIEVARLEQLLNKVESGEISFDVAFAINHNVRECFESIRSRRRSRIISHLSPRRVDEKRQSRKRGRSEIGNANFAWLRFEAEWEEFSERENLMELDEVPNLVEQSTALVEYTGEVDPEDVLFDMDDWDDVFPSIFDFGEPAHFDEQAAEMLFGAGTHASASAQIMSEYGDGLATKAAYWTASGGVSLFYKFSSTLFGDEKFLNKSFVSRFLTLKGSEDYVVKLVEDLMIFIYSIINSTTAYGRHIALITYLKLRGSPADFSVITLAANSIFSFVFTTPNLDEQSEDFFQDARKFIDSYDRLKQLAIFKKTYKFCMYLLAQGICDNFGVNFDLFNFSKLEEEAIRRDFTSRPNMIHCVLDTALFYCEIGVQCFKTGTLYPILHSGTAYEKWFDESRKLQRLALHTTNLEPHGTNTFQYITDLKKCISEGQSIKSFGILDVTEKKMMRIQVEALLKIDAELLTRQKAMEDRPAPFSLMIFGASSVAKSAFKQLFYYHFGRVMNLPLSEEYKYTRMPGQEFWDNFQSSMWATVIDDAAYVNPTTGREDTSVMEIIQMINNIALVPNQADLANKGRTPFLCKLVMATTNTRHLNAHAYFSCPIAVARRFPYIVELKLKEKFANDQGMVDPEKMPKASDTEFPDIWHIIVTTPYADEEAKLPKYKKIKEFDCIYDFLKWSTGRIRAHEASQINAMDTSKKMVTIPVCDTCFMPDNHCDCKNKTLDAVITKMINDGNTGITENRLVEIKQLAVNYSSSSEMSDEDHDAIDVVDFYNDKLVDATDNGTMSVDFLKDTISDFQTRYPNMKEQADELNAVWHYSTLHEQSDTTRHWWLNYVDTQTTLMKELYWDGKDTLLEFLGSVNCPACRNQETHECEWGYNMITNKPLYLPKMEDMKIIMNSSKSFKTKAWICNFVIWWIEYWPLLCLCPTIWFWGSMWKFRLLKWFFYDFESAYVLIQMMGHRAQRQIGFSRQTLYYLGVVGCVISSYKLVQFLYSNTFGDSAVGVDRDEENKFARQFEEHTEDSTGLRMACIETVKHMVVKTSIIDDTKPKLDVQGNTLSSDLGHKPIPDTEKKNVWYYNDPFIISSADVTQTSRCLKGKDQEKILLNKIRDNVACYAAPKDGGKMRPEVLCSSGVLFNVSGQIWVTNFHGVPSPPFHLTLYRSEQKEGITENVKDILVTETMLQGHADKDMMFIDLKVIRPGYNLCAYLGGPDLEGVFNGFYVGKNRSGSSFRTVVRNIKKKDTPLHNIDTKGTSKHYMIPTWSGSVEQDTLNGSCGSPLVVFCDAGAIILGIHALGGNANKCVALSLPNTFYNNVLENFKTPNISRGYIPISSESAPRELTDIHSKSPVLYTQSGTAYVYGSFKGFRVNHKSDVCKTSICDTVVKYGYKVETGKPCMTYMPYYHALQDMTKPVLTLDADLLQICKDAFLNDIITKLPQKEIDTLITLDDDTAINGAARVQYCDAMNKNTSIGAPFKRSKKHYLEEKAIDIESNMIIYRFNAEIQQRTNNLLSQYCDGLMGHAQFDAHIKDEALPFRKVISEKSRIFTGAETAYSLLMRKMYLTMVMLIQRNKEIFESYPGLVAQSAEWEKLLLTLRDEYDNGEKVREAIEDFLAGDFKLFDKTMSALVMLLAFSIIIDICKLHARSEEEYKIMWAIAYDTCFPTVDFNGDLIQFNGTNPSGHPLTVIINCLVLCLYFRYAFALLLREKGLSNSDIKKELFETFQKHVKIAAYGDDSVVAVRDLAWYNHTSIQRVLGACGIEFTMADKLAESIPYIPQSEISFLKRKWRWDEDLNVYVAPLDESSIAKMLTMCVPKKTICAEARDIDSISTAVREYFFYGKEVFLEKRTLFAKIIEECNLQSYVKDSTLPTWEELRDSFYANSKGVNIYRKLC